MAAAVDERLERYAELAVRVGVNVQPGQLLQINALVEHAPLVRAATRAAYDAGARYVDVRYLDNHVRRAMIERGPDEALQWTPPHLFERLDALAAERGGSLFVTGDPEPELMSDLDGDRVGRARMVELQRRALTYLGQRLNNWAVVAYPSEGWAATAFDEPDVERLWDAVAHAVRLDEPDPVTAWREHIASLKERAARLNELEIDSLRYRGGGTDLTIGLLPESHWHGGSTETVDDIEHVPNMPTEEVFTTPDWRRTQGVVRSTRPLPLLGTIVRDLEIRFEDGRAVDVAATSGADVVRAQLATDDGSACLGEVALVDGASRVGETGITFFDVLFDENAASHIAYGDAILAAVEGGDHLAPEGRRERGINQSAVHTDFMVGGAELEVDAVTRKGETVPLVRENRLQI